MSRMNGGEFFNFNLGCWQNRTTTSIALKVFSIRRLSYRRVFAKNLPSVTWGFVTAEGPGILESLPFDLAGN